MTFTIEVSELLSRAFYVEADTAEEAKQKIMNDYYNNDIVLTADDYVDNSIRFEIL